MLAAFETRCFSQFIRTCQYSFFSFEAQIATCHLPKQRAGVDFDPPHLFGLEPWDTCQNQGGGAHVHVCRGKIVGFYKSWGTYSMEGSAAVKMPNYLSMRKVICNKEVKRSYKAVA